MIENLQDSRKFTTFLKQRDIICLKMEQGKIFNFVWSDAGEELLELASYFEAQPGRPVTRISSSARRVRSALRKADMPGFVSAFCQTNCGDVSPNVLGAFCLDTGLPCDFNHSTCGGRNELCYGRGPGYYKILDKLKILLKIKFS